MNGKKKVIIIMAMFMGAMALVSVSSAHAPSNEMNAYIAGNPYKAPSGSQYSGFGFAYPFANYTSVLPQYDMVFAQSKGVSSINITTSTGSTVLKTTFWNGDNGTGVFNFTLPTGTYDLVVLISSEYYGQSTTIIYSVQVLTITQYVNYATQHETTQPIGNPLPGWEELIIGGVVISGIIVTMVRPIRSAYRTYKSRKGLPSEDDKNYKEMMN